MKKFLLLSLLIPLCSNSFANNKPDSFWTKKWKKSKGITQVVYDNQTTINEPSWNYKNRKLLNEASKDYLNKLSMTDAFHIDPELEDYLYQLINSIHPEKFPQQQKVQLNIRMIKSVIPEAFSFANGTIIISTGMLSLLHTEDELISVLAREIAHISLDHNVETYTAQQTKHTISAIIGATAYIASASNSYDKNKSFFEADYLGSVVGVGAMLLSDGILSALGVGYNRARTYEADEIAQEWMIKNQLNQYALPTVLRRLQIFRSQQEGTSRELSEKRLFLSHRFNNIIKKNKLTPIKAEVMPVNESYDTKISDCLKINAKLLVAENAYQEAIPYLDRSINSKWCDGETYLLKAISNRHLNFREKDNREILEILGKAEMNVVSDLPWIWSERGLIHLRLNENREALDAFIKFEEYFSVEQSETTLWARKMIAKLRKRLDQ
ncbi:MAG: M48 family metalloprotease [Marinifilaceae bacterium]